MNIEKLISDSVSLSPNRKGEWLDSLMPDLIDLRHLLHENPVAGFENELSSNFVVNFLETRGLKPLYRDLAGYGLLFRLVGQKNGEGNACRLIFRSELDGLPLTEQNKGIEYASKIHGAHHACGHDGHMVMLVGALALLLKCIHEWSGEVIAVFQPSEETGEGAKKFLDDLLSRDPHIFDGFTAISLHNVPGVDLGNLTVMKEGVFACASVGLSFHLKGSTSHASQPDLGKNPIPALSRLALEAQSLPRTVTLPPYNYPHHPLTISALVNIDAGNRAFGTSAGSGLLRFTIRSASEAVLDAMINHMIDRAKEEAENGEFELKFEQVEPFPATVNDDASVARFIECLRSGLPRESPCRNIHWLALPYPWSEDFGYFTSQCGGLMFGIGSGSTQPPLHSYNFDFPDDLIGIGADLWYCIVMNWNR